MHHHCNFSPHPLRNMRSKTNWHEKYASSFMEKPVKCKRIVTLGACSLVANSSWSRMHGKKLDELFQEPHGTTKQPKVRTETDFRLGKSGEQCKETALEASE